MARFRNFSMWRGRLPHWRADDENYYATFRHRRELSDDEAGLLYRRLIRSQGRRLLYLLLVVLPEQTEMVFRIAPGMGEGMDFSDVIEKSKRQAGSDIIKKSGERFPPFYAESYDRIIRDEAELNETLMKLVASAEAAAEDADTEYRWMFADEEAIAEA